MTNKAGPRKEAAQNRVQSRVADRAGRGNEPECEQTLAFPVQQMESIVEFE